MGTGIPWSIRIKKGGKAEYVRWDHPNGNTIDVCVCLYNADLADGCIANVLEEDIDDVLGNGGNYSDIEAVRERLGTQKVARGCEYCYASYWNQQALGFRRVTDDTHADMAALVAEVPDPRNRIIRLGKLVEVGHAAMRDNLLEFLELGRDNEVRFIMPTKMLEYDARVAELLRDTRSALNFSICADFLEEGPVSQGFNQERRIAEALRYRADGVRASLTLTCDVTGSIEHNAHLGYAVREAIAAHEEHGIPLRMLPIRLYGRKMTLKATGRTWDEVLSAPNFDLFDESATDETDVIRDRPYIKKNSIEIEPRVTHPDWSAWMDRFDGNSVGACGKVNGYEHCDKCGLENEMGHAPHIKFPISELAPVNISYRTNKGSTPLPLFRGTGIPAK